MKSKLFLRDHEDPIIDWLVQMSVLNMWLKQNDNFLVIYAKHVLIATKDLFFVILRFSLRNPM